MTPEEQAREIRPGTKNPYALYRGDEPLGFVKDPVEGRRIAAQSSLIGELVKALKDGNTWDQDCACKLCIAIAHAKEMGYE